ncbi:lytic murein transglycosylase B [Viridibacterium curvum]|uniref:Lytic murein transglycosylase B n=1 Tax=Viridibacterium curvum TaxID=1101404 RepID=A0ABP9QXH2_9RHOO
MITRPQLRYLTLSLALLPAASMAQNIPQTIPMAPATDASAAAPTAISPAASSAAAASAPLSTPAAAPISTTPATGYLARREVQDFVANLTQRLGVPRATVEQALAEAQPTPQVIELIKPPANPLVRSWQRYRARFLDNARISGGQAFMREHAEALATAETAYGVPKEIITAIIGVETVYGRNTGNFRALDALTTLAFDYPPRAELFRKELEALFLLAHERKEDVRSYKGSYAGAIGLPQFLPSSIRAFATDFDGDGHIDLRGSPRDAIGSVARYLAENGWKQGERIAIPAKLGERTDLDKLLAAGFIPSLGTEQLSQSGVSSSLGANEKATLIDLVTPGEATEYWLGLQNFYVITRYNKSSFYAMAVKDLAEAFSQPAVVNKQPRRKTASALRKPRRR